MMEFAKFAAFILSWASLALTIVAVAIPDWRINDVEGEVVELIRRTQGLWTKCAFFPTGNWQCEDYDRFFIALPAAITGARVFSVISLIFQVVCMVAQPFGMYCTRIPDGDGNEHEANKTKAKISIGCGALSILAGICIGIAVSWYAALVVEDYSRFTTGMSAGIETSVQRFIYGKGLYLGWVAMCTLIIQGVMLCCSSWGDQSNQTYDQNYHTGTQYADTPYNAYDSQAKFGQSQPMGMGDGGQGGHQYI